MASPVCFIKNHILHTLKLQVHLHGHMHQPPRGGDDSGRNTQARSPQAQGPRQPPTPSTPLSGKGSQGITTHRQLTCQGSRAGLQTGPPF